MASSKIRRSYSPSSCTLLLALLLQVNWTVGDLRPPKSQPFGYAFEYGVRDEASGTLYGHTESRNGITTTGQYTVHLPDGRIQTVKYTADHNGYRATVSYDRPARHPEKVLKQKQRAIHYPPVLIGHRVPTVGETSAGLVPISGNDNKKQPLVVTVNKNNIPVVPVRINNHPIVRVNNNVPVVPVVPFVNQNNVPHIGSVSSSSSTSSKINNLQFSNNHNFNRGVSPLISSSSPRVPVPTVPPIRPTTRPKPQPFTVPLHPLVAPTILPPRSQFPGRPWHHFTQSPTIHRDSKLPPSRNYLTVTSNFHQNSNYLPAQPSSNYLPAQPSSNYLPAQPSSNYLPAQPSSNYLPAQPTTNYLPVQSHSHPVVPSVPSGYLPVSQDTSKPAISINVPSVPPAIQYNNANTLTVPATSSYHDKYNEFSPTNTNNYNEFYNFPSSSIRTRPRVLPPNTYIPSASAPIIPSFNNLQASQSYNSIPSPQPSVDLRPTISFTENSNSNKNNQIDATKVNSLTRLHPPYQSHLNVPTNYAQPATHLDLPYKDSSNYENLLTELRPPYQSSYSGTIPNITGNSITSQNGVPVRLYGVPQQFSTNLNNYVSNTESTSISVTESFTSSEESIQSSFSSKLPTNDGQQSSTPSEKTEHTTRPTPQPIIVPEYNSLTPFSSQSYANPFPNVFIQPLDQRHPFTRKPFVFDPDASVFHNEPSIIVDFSHRGSSHEDDSDSVSLTAPYVVVASPYSPNPEGKFKGNQGRITDPNSVASHGIAPPDPADAGNVRLSPGFLPPHLARLRLQKIGGDIARTVPTPTPVQLKLRKHNNEHTKNDNSNKFTPIINNKAKNRFINTNQFGNVNQKNLPLRNRPSTFGEGTPHQFTPNSVAQFQRLPKQRRNSRTGAKVQNNSDPNSNLGKVKRFVSDDDAFREQTAATNHEEAKSTSSSFREAVSSNESRPLIRNG